MEGFVVFANLIESEKLACFRAVVSPDGAIVAVGAAGKVINSDLEGNHGLIHACHLRADFRAVANEVPPVLAKTCRVVFLCHRQRFIIREGVVVCSDIRVDFFGDILCAFDAHDRTLCAACENDCAVVSLDFVGGFLESDRDGTFGVFLLLGTGTARCDIGVRWFAGIFGTAGIFLCLRGILGTSTFRFVVLDV